MRLLNTFLMACIAIAVQAQTSFQMDITVNNLTLQADMVDNQATAELKAMLENGTVTVNLHEYGGFERVGSLPQSLTTSDQSITATTGDIVLYVGNQIVFMLGSNSWSYIRLGHINADKNTLESFFGPGNSTVTLSLPGSTAIDGITTGDSEATEYYDLQGRRITGEARGLVIEKKGNKTRKVYKNN